jgi:hypothetical protein
MPSRRGGLFRGAVGRSRTRHHPHNHGKRREPLQPWCPLTPGTPEKCGAFGRGVPQALSAPIPPAGGLDPPWTADAAGDQQQPGQTHCSAGGPRWIEHPLRGQTAPAEEARGHLSIPLCNDLQQDGQCRPRRQFHLCIVWESRQPQGERSRDAPTPLPRGTNPWDSRNLFLITPTTTAT